MEKAKLQKAAKFIPQIKIFKGLSQSQTKKLFALGKEKNIRSGDVLFKAGDASNELYILLSGQLSVKGHTQTISVIDTFGVVGEMGVFTRQPRSASIVATKDSALLVIRHRDLFHLIKRDKEFGYAVCMNVIHNLSEHLVFSNNLFEFYYMIGPANKKA